jgi:hypothetical protein
MGINFVSAGKKKLFLINFISNRVSFINTEGIQTIGNILARDVYISELKRLKVKVALRGFSIPRPLGSIVFLCQKIPAFISRDATNHTEARGLYQRRRKQFPQILLADL